MRMVWLAALAAIAATLGWLAHWQTTTGLDTKANQRTANVTRGLPLNHWSLTNPEDIIAGHVFGNATVRFDEDGLHITSKGDQIEVGLKLTEPLDLDRYGLIQLQVQSDSRFGYQWSTHFRGASSPCRSQPQRIVDGLLRAHLGRLDWACQLPIHPTVVSLRLVVDGPAGATLTLSDVRILSAEILLPPSAADVPVVTQASDIAGVVSQLIALPQSVLPVASVPLGWRDAAGLNRRSQLRDWVPGVVTVTTPNFRSDVPISARPAIATTQFLFAILLLIWRWPPRPPKWRVPVQIAAALLMPLWLSVGLRMGTPLSLLDQGFILTGAVYLVHRVFDSAPSWKWIGRPAAWSIPAASVALTIALALALHGNSDLDWPEAVTALRYFGWAAIQQLILSRIVADRLTEIGWSVPWIALTTATAFALLHAPNQSLMLMTLIGGLLWMWNWQRHRALLPNVVAHAVCGLIASSAIDRSWLWSAEVGSRFFAG